MDANPHQDSTPNNGFTSIQDFPEYHELSASQQEIIRKYINYHFIIKDDESSSDSIKHNIYKTYSKTIAVLLAKLEVYHHDLPRDTVALIEMIFRILALSGAEENPEKIDKYYDSAIRYENYLINILYLKLTRCYLKVINAYRKTFSHFNHKGVQYQNETEGTDIPFLSYADNSIKEIKKFKKKGKIRLKQYTKYKFYSKRKYIDPLLLDFDIDVNVINDLKDAFDLSENLMLDMEKKYCQIIGLGYKTSLLMSVIYKIPEIIATVISILTIVLYIQRKGVI